MDLQGLIFGIGLKHMAKSKDTKREPRDVYPKEEMGVRELVELLIRDKADKVDLANTKAAIIDKIHEEFKPFHRLAGEFGTVKRIFYIGLTIAIGLLVKMAFFPKLWTYTGTG